MPRNGFSSQDARNLRTLLLLNVFAPEELGSRIKQAREEADLTQPDLAELIGLGLRQVQNLESGVSKPYGHVREIAEATGKSVEWLLHGNGTLTDEDRLRQILREELEGVRSSVASDLAVALENFAQQMEHEIVQALSEKRPASARKR